MTTAPVSPSLISVQTHLRVAGTPYYEDGTPTRTIGALLDLGVGRVRDTFRVGWPTQNAQLGMLADQAHVQLTLTIQAADAIADFVSGVQALLAAHPGSVVAVEGVNEWDKQGGDWANQLRTHQQSFYAAVKAAMPSMPVLAPALADPTKASTLGDLSAYCDFGNAHAYPNGSPTDPWLATCIAGAATVSGAKPVIVTETGYTNALADPDTLYTHPVTEAVSGGYMGELVVDLLAQGAVWVGIYELIDQGPQGGPTGTDVEQGFGLLRNDWSQKPAYVTLKNLMAGTDPTSAPGPSGSTTLQPVTTIRLRRGTASAWTAANPVLQSGEPGFETDTGLLKIGDGTTAWTSLPYETGGGGGGGTGTIPAATQSVAGITRYSSDTQAVDGTATDVAVTPHALAAALADITVLTNVLVLRWTGGAWPALPTTKPAGVSLILAIGPADTFTAQSWVGDAADQVPILFFPNADLA